MESVMVASSTTLALYALFCQEQDIVPILEPEFLMDGGHSQKECGEVTARNLDILFAQLKIFGVWIPGIILKTNMVISGKDAEVQATVEEVATATIACLKAHVPHDIGGIVFLSGGQDDSKATEHLNTMHMMGELPWPLSFSYARAIQNPTLTHWATHREDIAGAQAKLLERAKANSLASVGKYTTQ
jgi:fructose-bisphosphate aldolase class I